MDNFADRRRYATFWVHRGFCQYQRRGRRLIRLPHDKADLVNRALRLLAEEQERTGVRPSVAWAAQRCGPRGGAINPAQLEALLDLWQRTEALELDQPSPSRPEARESGTTMLALVADPAPVDPAVLTPSLPRRISLMGQPPTPPARPTAETRSVPSCPCCWSDWIRCPGACSGIDICGSIH